VRFVDANVFLRFLTGEPEWQGRRSQELFEAIEAGNERVATNIIVIFEVVWVLNRSKKLPMNTVRDLVLPIILLPSIRLADKDLLATAFEYSIAWNVPFADAYSAAYMERHGVTEIYSWDRHFDRIDGITRIGPGQPAE
jgi:uncharacterized protein